MNFGFGKEYPEELLHITEDGKHHGFDYLTPTSNEVYNPKDAVFYSTGFGALEGLYLITKFWKKEKGKTITYRFLALHLSRTFTSRMTPGTKIQQDVVLALTGDSGSAKGHPHFHGEIQKLTNGIWIPVHPGFVFGNT